MRPLTSTSARSRLALGPRLHQLSLSTVASCQSEPVSDEDPAALPAASVAPEILPEAVVATPVAPVDWIVTRLTKCHPAHIRDMPVQHRPNPSLILFQLASAETLIGQ